jgi:hypothetical protein
MTELELQAQVADYIRLKYPSVIFHSDFGSGIKLTMGQAIRQKRLNGGRRSWPDMFIAETVISKIRHDDGSYNAYSGLFVELKREGTRIFKKDGKDAGGAKRLERVLGRDFGQRQLLRHRRGKAWR